MKNWIHNAWLRAVARKQDNAKAVGVAFGAALLVVCCGLGDSQAQGDPDRLPGSTIREEDLPADPQPYQPLPNSTALPGRQAGERPFGSGWGWTQPIPPPGWDPGPPPTLPDPPALPVYLKETDDMDEIQTKKTRKKKKKKGKKDGQLDTVRLSPNELVALRFVEEGEGILEGGEPERARILFEQAIEIAPSQPYGYHFLGRIAFTQGQRQQALAFLQKAELLLSRTNTEWLGETTCLTGQVAEDLGDFDQARSAYERCLHFTPSNLRALTALTRLSEEEPIPEPYFPQNVPRTNAFQTQTDPARNRDLMR